MIVAAAVVEGTRRHLVEMGADFGVDGRRRRKLGEGRPYSRCSGGLRGRRRCCRLAAAVVADYNANLQNNKNRAAVGGDETLASVPVRWRWRCSEDLEIRKLGFRTLKKMFQELA